MIIEILAISLVVLCGLVILFICFKKVYLSLLYNVYSRRYRIIFNGSSFN